MAVRTSVGRCSGGVGFVRVASPTWIHTTAPMCAHPVKPRRTTSNGFAAGDGEYKRGDQVSIDTDAPEPLAISY